MAFGHQMFNKTYLIVASKALETKGKSRKIGLYQNLNFFHLEEEKKNWKGNQWNGEVFVNHVSDKGLVSMIHKELMTQQQKDSPT